MQDPRRGSQLGAKERLSSASKTNFNPPSFAQDSHNCKWAKQQVYFPQFSGWGKEYGAFSVGQREKDVVIEYIINQREHHKSRPFEDEYRAIIEECGLEWNDFRLT